MTVTPDSARLADLLRDELKFLKDEQRDRIGRRDQMVYSVIAGIAAVAAGTRLVGAPVALLLPLVTLALGWVYLTNDEKVSAIGRYIRTDLQPRLSALAGEPVLRWETVHRSDPRRRQRKVGQLAVDLIVFVVPAAAALAWYWSHAASAGILLACSIVEALAVVLAAWQLISYADLAHGA